MQKKRRVQAIFRRANEAGRRRVLNDAVRKVKADEAARVNRSGLHQQVYFLVDKLGVDAAAKVLDREISRQKEDGELHQSLLAAGAMSALTRIVHDLKAAEAEGVLSTPPSAQIRFVLGMPGGREKILWILNQLASL